MLYTMNMLLELFKVSFCLLLYGVYLSLQMYVFFINCNLKTLFEHWLKLHNVYYQSVRNTLNVWVNLYLHGACHAQNVIRKHGTFDLNWHNGESCLDQNIFACKTHAKKNYFSHHVCVHWQLMKKQIIVWKEK